MYRIDQKGNWQMHTFAQKCSIWGNTQIDWPATAYRLDSKAVLQNEPILTDGVLSKLPLAVHPPPLGDTCCSNP